MNRNCAAQNIHRNTSQFLVLVILILNGNGIKNPFFNKSIIGLGYKIKPMIDDAFFSFNFWKFLKAEQILFLLKLGNEIVSYNFFPKVMDRQQQLLECLLLLIAVDSPAPGNSQMEKALRQQA